MADTLSGTVLCRLEEIEDGEARGFDIGTGMNRRAILVLRQGAEVRGFENVCPHLGTPLEFQPDDFMSEDGRHIVCATHGALFQPEDGYCVSGPCAGESLKPVQVVLDSASQVILPAAGR